MTIASRAQTCKQHEEVAVLIHTQLSPPSEDAKQADTPLPLYLHLTALQTPTLTSRLSNQCLPACRLKGSGCSHCGQQRPLPEAPVSSRENTYDLSSGVSKDLWTCEATSV